MLARRIALVAASGVLIAPGARAAPTVSPSQPLTGRATRLDVAQDGSARVIVQDRGATFTQLTAPPGARFGSASAPLPTGGGDAYALDYSGDRSGVALTSTGPGGSDTTVVTFAPDGGGRRRFVLSPKPATQADLAVAADGSAVITWGSGRGAYLLARVGHRAFGARQRLRARTSAGVAVAVAPGGDGLVVSDGLSPRRAVQLLRDGRLGPARTLDGVVSAQPAMGPDGTGALAVLQLVGRDRYALAATTVAPAARSVGAPRRLERQRGRGPLPPEDPTADVAEDGSAIVTWDRGGRTVVREGPSLGTRTLLPAAQGTALVRAGRDGELLAFGGGDGDPHDLAVSLRPAGASAWGRATAHLSVATGATELGVSAFTPDGGALLAVTPVNAVSDGRSELFRVVP